MNESVCRADSRYVSVNKINRLWLEGACSYWVGVRSAKAGFTLAEVLITLGIIGVVAAMTIPGLMTAHLKHVTETKLEKAVSTLNQVIRLSEDENGQMENWDKTLSHKDFINRYFAPHMKIMQLCNPITDCGYKVKNAAQTWKNLRGVYSSYSGANYRGRTPILAMDGIVYTFNFLNDGNASEVDNDKTIIIDINGYQKPNQFGKDVYFLYRVEEADSIIPYGADKSKEEIKKDCSVTGTGMYCAALIRDNGWKIPNGYPLK